MGWGTHVGHFAHGPVGLRRQPFNVRVSTGADGDPPTRWRIPKGKCVACRHGHDEVRVNWRVPTAAEQVGGVIAITDIAEPLSDPNAGYPHPREVRLAL